MFAVTHSCAHEGVLSFVVRVEARVSGGIPSFVVVGLPDAAVREGRERVRAAIQATIENYERRRELVNLSPAHRRKVGATFDLAVAMALLAASGHCDPAAIAETAFLGELSLDGRLRAVSGTLPAARIAARRRLKRLVVPAANGEEAAISGGIEVFTADSLGSALTLVRGGYSDQPVRTDIAALLARGNETSQTDLCEVRAQHAARRALEIAAAGEHHLFLTGPPGAGKSMLAERLATILPPLSLEDAVTVTSIHSIAGLTRSAGGSPLVTQRPVRTPHHSVSVAGMVGGGYHPVPGEASLAHKGVLFLDELPEFSAQLLNQLREPLERKTLTVSRAGSKAAFPASFLLVAAANPCPCGYFRTGAGNCSCSFHAVARYRARVSGPILDRIDLHVAVERVAFAELCADECGESSATVRERVVRAREFRTKRSVSLVLPEANALLANAAELMRLSARGVTRVRQVARTIADLATSEAVSAAHIAEAVQFRRSAWQDPLEPA